MCIEEWIRAEQSRAEQSKALTPKRRFEDVSPLYPEAGGGNGVQLSEALHEDTARGRRRYLSTLSRRHALQVA